MTTVGPDGGGNPSKRTAIAAFSSNSDGRKNSVLLTKRPRSSAPFGTASVPAALSEPIRHRSLAHRARRAHRRPHIGMIACRQIRAEHPICAHGRGRGHVQLAEQRGECALS
jgi:hypothetical protein